MRLIDPELLRTFLAFVDGGSLARAAAIVGRSPSAVTAQMQRLEESVGEPLLAAAGRGRALTPAGEDLVIHARRILDAHRDAWLSLRGARADGRFTLGATQDFADATLPDLLRGFARSHPRVRLELRIGRSAELNRAFEEGAIDVLIAMRAAPAPDERAVLREPMIWLGARAGLAFEAGEVPLALLDPPCGFRAAALAALEAAGRRHRVVATSGSLSGLRAAVRSGIALTLRTARWMGEDLVDVTAALSLPAVPEAEFGIRLRRDAEPAAGDFAEMLCDEIDAVRAGGRQ
ncbi:MAG: LysR substrate-binding domain-containing protein [Xanthobacteraceae bacterium]